MFVLNILGLSYQPRHLDWMKGEIKGPEHTKFNPNGRTPTLIDHSNDDYSVWYVYTSQIIDTWLTGWRTQGIGCHTPLSGRAV